MLNDEKVCELKIIIDNIKEKSYTDICEAIKLSSELNYILKKDIPSSIGGVPQREVKFHCSKPEDLNSKKTNIYRIHEKLNFIKNEIDSLINCLK